MINSNPGRRATMNTNLIARKGNPLCSLLEKVTLAYSSTVCVQQQVFGCIAQDETPIYHNASKDLCLNQAKEYFDFHSTHTSEIS